MDASNGAGGWNATSNLSLCLTVKAGSTTAGHTVLQSTDKSAVCWFNETVAGTAEPNNWDSFKASNVTNWQKLVLVKPATIAASTSTA